MHWNTIFVSLFMVAVAVSALATIVFNGLPTSAIIAMGAIAGVAVLALAYVAKTWSTVPLKGEDQEMYLKGAEVGSRFGGKLPGVPGVAGIGGDVDALGGPSAEVNLDDIDLKAVLKDVPCPACKRPLA